jgi:hypothetical protein
MLTNYFKTAKSLSLSLPTNRSLMLFAVSMLALAGSALGQQSATDLAVASGSTTACQSTYTFGSGQTLFNFCTTSNGNVVQFTSPGGFEHIREGAIQEGYGICDGGTGISYFDYAGGGDSGNWNAAVITQPHGPNTFPLKITRSTSDGAFSLTQKFARNTSERIVTITMSLKNSSGVNTTITFLRYADINANNAAGGTFNNEFDYGIGSAWGYNTGQYGLMLSIVPTSVSHDSSVQKIRAGPVPCNPFANEAATPFFGNGSAVVLFDFPLVSGATRTLGVKYKPF